MHRFLESVEHIYLYSTHIHVRMYVCTYRHCTCTKLPKDKQIAFTVCVGQTIGMVISSLDYLESVNLKQSISQLYMYFKIVGMVTKKETGYYKNKLL